MGMGRGMEMGMGWRWGEDGDGMEMEMGMGWRWGRGWSEDGAAHPIPDAALCCGVGDLWP